MDVVLIGYGRMGKTIESLASELNFRIVGVIDAQTEADERRRMLSLGEVAVEFSHPSSAFENIVEAVEAGVPVVSGTTGWLDRFADLQGIIEQHDGSFFYASNFSIGVNLLFAINERLARLMNAFPEYDVTIEETHHIHKKDAPSGTAITLAEGIVEQLERKSSWDTEKVDPRLLRINSIREGEVFGRHEIHYKSSIDSIWLGHDAHSRKGFATGAVLAARWLMGRKGIYSMKDLLGL